VRLFIAIDLNEESRRAAATLAEEVAERLQSAGAIDRKGVTWVSAHNLHLTLRFLGELEEEMAHRVTAEMERPFRTPAFDLALSGLGVFPPGGPPRVIWIGVKGATDQLAALHQEVESRLHALRIEPGSRGFQGHLTLGRFRKPAGPRARDLICTRIPSRDIGPSLIDQVTLYQSMLSPRGAVYTPLARAPLSG
jgi:RNA 2',3'-cyclic 3'-phosphodiesterase